jgi:hypothetical protein
VVSFTTQGRRGRYPLEERLSGALSRSGSCEEQKNTSGEKKFDRHAHSPSLYILRYRGSSLIMIGRKYVLHSCETSFFNRTTSRGNYNGSKTQEDEAVVLVSVYKLSLT